MGWLWSSNDSNAASAGHEAATTPAPTRSVALTEEQKLRIFGRPNAPNKTPPTRDEQADAELDAFLRSFEAGQAPSQPTPAIQSSNSRSQIPSEPVNVQRIRPDGTLDISPEATYPRTMSCRQAFDQAFYCQSLGGKFNDIYRYGHLRSCSDQWGAFWFCMRTRTLPDQDRQRAVKEYYVEREEKRKKEFGSSEDVWRIRQTAVQRAFDRDPDADEDDATLVKQ